eukprot:scaffold5389_cov76-Isochrysis_galbana.AAC.2
MARRPAAATGAALRAGAKAACEEVAVDTSSPSARAAMRLPQDVRMACSLSRLSAGWSDGSSTCVSTKLPAMPKMPERAHPNQDGNRSERALIDRTPLV